LYEFIQEYLKINNVPVGGNDTREKEEPLLQTKPFIVFMLWLILKSHAAVMVSIYYSYFDCIFFRMSKSAD